MTAGEFVFPASAGCQPAAFGRRAESIFAKGASLELPRELKRRGVLGRLPRTTGQRPVLPGVGFMP